MLTHLRSYWFGYLFLAFVTGVTVVVVGFVQETNRSALKFFADRGCIASAREANYLVYMPQGGVQRLGARRLYLCKDGESYIR